MKTAAISKSDQLRALREARFDAAVRASRAARRAPAAKIIAGLKRVIAVAEGKTKPAKVAVVEAAAPARKKKAKKTVRRGAPRAMPSH